MRDSETTVSELIKLVEDFVAKREWQRFHDPKNLSMSMAIEAGELMEHFQWLRSDELAAVVKDDEKMAQVREELADVAAYLLSFAATMEIDLSSALEQKMRKNARKYPIEEFRGKFE